jgi:molecular chaperone DnaK (HSP70)
MSTRRRNRDTTSASNINPHLIHTTIQDPLIILGLDYGTTNTGVFSCRSSSHQILIDDRVGLAWAEFDGSNKLTIDDVKIFIEWPIKKNRIVPSEISYSRGKGAKQWGWSIDNDSKVLKWTKLEFEPKTTAKEFDVVRQLIKGLDDMDRLRKNTAEQVPRDMSKSAEDIVRDYIGKVAREWYIYINSERPQLLRGVPLDIVLTYPAVG